MEISDIPNRKFKIVFLKILSEVKGVMYEKKGGGNK